MSNVEFFAPGPMTYDMNILHDIVNDRSKPKTQRRIEFKRYLEGALDRCRKGFSLEGRRKGQLVDYLVEINRIESLIRSVDSLPRPTSEY